MITKPIYIILFIIVPLIHKAQTYKTESKNCGACKKEVSINSKIGMTCPHCGVTWGKENTSQTNTYQNNYNKDYSNTYKNKSYGNTNNQDHIPSIFDNQKHNSYYSKAIPKKTCNVRSSPSISASIVASADQNNKFDIVEIKGDWVQIKFVTDSYYGRQTSYGWIYKSLLYLE